MLKAIFWDLDGTLIDSDTIRKNGFKHIFKKFKKVEVEKLLVYHEENGGLSRYNKINYFFRVVKNQKINETILNKYASDYSNYMRQNLFDLKLKFRYADYLLKEGKAFDQYLITASDEFEANQLCAKIKIKKYFKNILGSPKSKRQNIIDLLIKTKLSFNEVLYIGDTINDLNTCRDLRVPFIGINNPNLKDSSKYYISAGKEISDFKNIIFKMIKK